MDEKQREQNMTSSGGTDGAGAGQVIINTAECCMCGDPGFSDQLFQCKVCQFRSQHRYCSNMYPKAESLGTCNWCLSQSQKEDSKEKSSPNSSNSNSNGDGDESKNKRSIRNKGLIRGSGLHLQLQKLPIKKHKSPEAVSVTSARKRIVTKGALEERLRRTKSEDIANTSGATATSTRQVFRNKVRRYKLLDEVSS